MIRVQHTIFAWRARRLITPSGAKTLASGSVPQILWPCCPLDLFCNMSKKRLEFV